VNRLRLGLAVALVAAVLLGGFGYWTRSGRTKPAECSGSITGSELKSPFEKGPPFTDPRVTNLAESLQTIGHPIAGVGYDYDRWLNLAALEHDLVVWTKHNPTWTLLDGQTLKPRWGARAPAAGMTWTASSNRFFSIGVGKQVRVDALGIASGDSAWCTTLPGAAAPADISTAVTSDDGVLVATPTGAGATLSRLAGKNGRISWQAAMSEQPDSIVIINDEVAVVGGLAYGAAFNPEQLGTTTRPTLQGINVADGSREWTWTSKDAGALRVLGPDGDAVLVAVVSSERIRISRVDQLGRSHELFDLPARDLQATIRDGVLVTRESQQLVGRTAATGEVLWKSRIPTKPQFFPYGYDLASAPALGSSELLLGTTDALVTLQVHTGERESWALPTDGINTTYWPYQLAVTGDGHLTGVVTNSGAVITEGQPRS
jgi:hypothetical protein